MDDEQEVEAEGPAIPPGFRLHNGVLVPAEQPAITRIIAKSPPKPDPRRRWLIGGGVLLVLVLVVAAVTGSTRHDERHAPADEKSFLKAVQHGQDRVQHGNAVTLVSAKAEREKALCDLLTPLHQKVHGWVGTINGIDTHDDEGIITVSIGHDTDLRTGSGAGVDKRVLLRPGSKVFESVAKLDDGDRVVIGGTFVRDGGFCVKETSAFAKNGMMTPDFLFLFSSIHPA
jgi:hypothetical protein